MIVEPVTAAAPIGADQEAPHSAQTKRDHVPENQTTIWRGQVTEAESTVELHPIG